MRDQNVYFPLSFVISDLQVPCHQQTKYVMLEPVAVSQNPQKWPNRKFSFIKLKFRTFIFTYILVE